MTQHRGASRRYGQGLFDHMGCADMPDSVGGSARVVATDLAGSTPQGTAPTFVFVDLHVTAAQPSDTVPASMASTMASPHVSGSVYQPSGDARPAISIRGPATMARLGVSLMTA